MAKTTKKPVALLASLGIITGLTTAGLQVSCVDDNGITFLPEEEVVLQEFVSGEGANFDGVKVLGDGEFKKVGKLCFKTSADYVAAKDKEFNKYKGLSEKERALFRGNRAFLLENLINHEISKRGQISFATETGDLILDIINHLNNQ